MQNQENVVNADNVVEFGFQKTPKDYSKVQKILGRILIRGLVFVYNIIGLIATVNTFRGFWYLFDNYFQVNHDFLTGTSNELLRQINQTEHIENAEERKYPSSILPWYTKGYLRAESSVKFGKSVLGN